MTAMHMLIAVLMLVAVPAGIVVVWAQRRSSTTPSRLWLALALSLSLPIFGPLLAIIVCSTRGTDQLSRDLQQSSSRPRYDSPNTIERLAKMPPIPDRLLSGAPSERLTGLVTLADRADLESVTMLRWTLEHGSPDAVLDAALTLEEIELRWERQRREAFDALQERATAATALAAGQRAAQGILADIAAPSRAPELLDASRRCYKQALVLNRDSQTRSVSNYDIGMHHAILELCAGQPRIAVKLIESLLPPSSRDAPPALLQILARARFASRDVYRTDGAQLPLQTINPLRNPTPHSAPSSGNQIRRSG